MKIVTMLHNVYGAGVVSGLGDAAVEFPMNQVVTLRERPDWTVFPEDAPFNFLGKDLRPLLKAKWPWVQEELAKAEFCYNWIREQKPDALVVWQDEYATYRGALLAAKDLDIPTVELSHGNIFTKKLGHWAARRKYVDYILGCSWEYRDWHSFYALEGTPVVTGSIIPDIYCGVDVEQLRSTSRFELNIPAEAPVVTFLTDAVFKRNAWQDPGLSYNMCSEFFKTFRLYQTIVPTAHLIIKIHPYEKNFQGEPMKATDYADLAKHHGINNFIIIGRDDPHVLALAPTDLLVGRPASSMASGYILGIPALVLGPEPWFNRNKFFGRGALVASNTQELFKTFMDIMLTKGVMEDLIAATEKGAGYFAGSTDGRATERVIRAIKQIAEGGVPDESCWAPAPGIKTKPLFRSSWEEGLLKRGLPGFSGGGPGGRSEQDPLALGD